jgi:uncharacterized membrane protein (DUF2068 family)
MSSRELRVCGRRGHVLYEPIEAELRNRLHVQTPVGEAWRCLRCGVYAVATPTERGPAADAPVPARGKALRQEIILRLLAVERIVRGVLLLAAAYGIHRFASAQTALRQAFVTDLPIARPLAEQLGFDIDRSTLIRDYDKAVNASHTTLTWIAVGVAVYAVIELVEGVGLWLTRRWAEYLTVVATAVFLPIEIRDLLVSATVTHVLTFAINVLAVVYLVVAKRLFGVRGGRKRYLEELSSESLLELEAGATTAGGIGRGLPGADAGMGTDRRRSERSRS